MTASRRLIGLGSLAVAGALLPAAPSVAAFAATATDPVGDAIAPGPDLTDAGLGYDPDTGQLVGAVRFAEAPEGRGVLTLFAGSRTSTGCNGYPAVGFSTFTDDFDANWLRLDDTTGKGQNGEADKTGGDDRIQRFEATDRQLKGRKKPDCAIATVNEPGNSANVYDVVGPFSLKGLPDLSVRVRNVPRQKLKLGQTQRIRVTVTNTGDGTARGVKLRLAARRGLKSSPRVSKIGTLSSGRRKTITVKVKLVGGARDTTEVPITASAGKLKAEAEIELRRRAPKSPPSSDGGRAGSSSGGSKLCTRYLADLSGQSGGSLILVPC